MTGNLHNLKPGTSAKIQVNSKTSSGGVSGVKIKLFRGRFPLLTDMDEAHSLNSMSG